MQKKKIFPKQNGVSFRIQKIISTTLCLMKEKSKEKVAQIILNFKNREK